jgi:hypothetical protein
MAWTKRQKAEAFRSGARRMERKKADALRKELKNLKRKS